MRPALLPAALLLALLAAPPAGGGTTGALVPLRDAVVAKRLGLDPAAPRREGRALDRALRLLDRERSRVDEELRDAAGACRLLDRAFPGDPDLDPALGAAAAALSDRVQDDRAALLAWLGRLRSARDERLLARRIPAIDGRLSRAAETAVRWKRVREEGRASRLIARTRDRLRIDVPAPGDLPFEGIAPDFSLEDRNPGSATFGAAVSPRDHGGRLSAWYFLQAT